MTEKQKDRIYKKYISIREGHQEHEEMLTYFHSNFIEPKTNVCILQLLVINAPSYFRKVGREKVFIEKCVFTIAKQPTPQAKEALLNFAFSTNETIKRAAQLYLTKIAYFSAE